ncbi:orotidine-5'-phosphate decarboxylase [Duncaniella muris]|jgi:orotidine-5'-phosphate decarboxylase|uniref:orotidine-5'-phosphate decarboxylase n=1 Tax=Duncaniella muris TaxID=2094150 RepID=UPI000A93E51A|nr:orotidine-5'-phosphate decarboxylase [Duncaniella muris]
MNRQQIIEQIRKKGTFLCVGLDTDIKKIPEHLLTEEDPMFAFNRAIIDATAPYCVAYKPNTAFYESRGTEGWQTLERTVNYLRTNYPDHFIIADAKRGDIGNTSSLYARAFFENMGVDAITVAPYMGFDSVKPFMDYESKWVILLALTSNPGSRDFQFLTDMTGTRLFEHVLETAQKWGTTENLMFVVGATQGAMFAEVRRVAPQSFLLVPGVGAQGGSLEEVAKWGMTPECGLLVNSSRGIIYASSGTDFADAAAAEARKLRDHMTILLSTYGVI